MDTLKDRFINGEKNIKRFSNPFNFMDFCRKNHLNESNSKTYYDKEKLMMYIKY